MKILKLKIIGMILFLSSMTQAQVSVNVNIGSPPLWGPIGYTDVRYYYLPDVEAYYDIQTSMFIYYGGGLWIHGAYLPGVYRNYDLYGGYKVVMTDYHGNSPHDHFHDHKKKYAKGYHGKPQKTIGSKPGNGNSKSNGSSNKKTGNGGGKSSNQSSGNKSSTQSSGRKSSNQSSGKNNGSGGNNSSKGNNMGGGKKK